MWTKRINITGSNLKNTFLTSDAVDFLMAQKNGSKYVILYQMLCLKNNKHRRTVSKRNR